eukprot:2987529-Pleurochrysis_carterae.AAC.1
MRFNNTSEPLQKQLNSHCGTGASGGLLDIRKPKHVVPRESCNQTDLSQPTLSLTASRLPLAPTICRTIEPRDAPALNPHDRPICGSEYQSHAKGDAQGSACAHPTATEDLFQGLRSSSPGLRSLFQYLGEAIARGPIWYYQVYPSLCPITAPSAAQI